MMMMTFKEWCDYKIDPADLWVKAVDPTGEDKDNIKIPLGLSANPSNITRFTNHPEMNTKMVFYSFGITDTIRTRFSGNMLNQYQDNITRATIKRTLDKTYTMTPMKKDDYFNEIGKYKFNISPPGCGKDCYRHYETWASKGIPIIKYDKFIADKYRWLPILWTNDYSEINDQYLEEQYDKIVNSSNKYDFRRVLLSYYTYEMQRQINIVSEYPTHTDVNIARTLQHKLWNFHDYFK